MSFSKYQKVARIGTVDVEGILEGKCYVFPKLDGTNASVWLEDGEMCAGSRNRELSEAQDNANFYKKVKEDKNIKEYLEENPTHRLYGEFLVPHAIKGYKEDAWRKFYVFDVMVKDENGKENYLTYEEYLPKLKEYDLDYVPLISEGNSYSYEELKELANGEDFLMEEGIGEGIVIKNYDYVNRFGRITWGKMIADEFKERETKKKNKEKDEGCEIEGLILEEKVVDKCCTEAFIEKEFAKVELRHNGFSSRYIGELLEQVWREFLTEEIHNIVLEYRNPTINFKILQYGVNNKVKEVKSDIFR